VAAGCKRIRHLGLERGAFAERLKLMDPPAVDTFDKQTCLGLSRRSIVIGCMVLLMLGTGCGSPASTGVDGPVMRHLERSSSQDGMAAEVRGVLELDGECLYVALDEVGERYPVVWPAGTRWDASNQAVITSRGISMAVGDEVYGSGGYLYVDDVERIAGSAASALAARCVDNTYGEIAVVNNADTAIGPADS